MIEYLLIMIVVILLWINFNLDKIIKKKDSYTFYLKNPEQDELIEKIQKDLEQIKRQRMDIFNTSAFRLFFIRLKKYFQNHADILEQIKDKMK